MFVYNTATHIIVGVYFDNEPKNYKHVVKEKSNNSRQ